jgi:hypothetical protein
MEIRLTRPTESAAKISPMTMQMKVATVMAGERRPSIRTVQTRISETREAIALAARKTFASQMQRNDFIVRAVQHQHGARYAADVGCRVEIITQKNQPGKNRENRIGHIPCGTECGLDNQPFRVNLGGQLRRRHNAAERAVEQNDLFPIELALISQIAPGCPGVLIESILIRLAQALAVTAVVEDKDIQANPVKDRNGGAAMGDVACIAVKKEQGLVRAMTRDVPAMQAHAILGLQEDIFIAESPVGRCPVERCVREKDHRGLLQIHAAIQQGQPEQQEQDVFYHSIFCNFSKSPGNLVRPSKAGR